jgi:O-acetylhomoserine/O-acetylserine sulfhydrylase-like pyridoxal-dependent enzyme
MDQEYSDGVKCYIAQAEAYLEKRKEYRDKVRKLKFETIAVHGMFSAEESFSGAQGGIIEPLFPSTSQGYRDSDEMEAALAYLTPTWCYSRIHNPTNYYLEETLALLDSYGCAEDATALATASGLSAIKQAAEPFLDVNADPGKEINFVATAQVYGGTFQLFNLRMRERGAEVRWVAEPRDLDEWKKLIDGNTRFLYGEMPSNPQQACFDIASVSELAHSHEIPFIIDSTIATPALMRPLQHGADIVAHSLTKTIGSGGWSLGGAVVAKQNIISRHLPEDVKKDFALWLKLWPFRDSGPCMSSFSAFFFLNELRTLKMRVENFSRNTMKVAEFLSEHPNVKQVDYLGLPNHPLHELASKYMRLVDTEEPMFGHLMSFTVKGEPQDARDFLDRMERIWRATDLGRIKSVATIPAISTHLQQGEEGRELAKINMNMVRLCVGGEHPDDVIADLDQALRAV